MGKSMKGKHGAPATPKIAKDPKLGGGKVKFSNEDRAKSNQQGDKKTKKGNPG